MLILSILPFLILLLSVYTARLFVLSNKVISDSLSEIVGDDKIPFLVSYIVSLYIVPVFRGGSRSDQSDHATKTPRKWIGKKNSPGVKLRTVHNTSKFTVQFQKYPSGQGLQTWTGRKRPHAWVLLASSPNSSDLIDYLDFCLFCGEFWSLERSGAATKPI